jgi:hypothetical protein
VVEPDESRGVDVDGCAEAKLVLAECWPTVSHMCDVVWLCGQQGLCAE